MILGFLLFCWRVSRKRKFKFKSIEMAKLKLNDLKIGQTVKFKKPSGTPISNEWLDLSNLTGKITQVIDDPKGVNKKEVFIKLNKDMGEMLEEWDNQVIYVNEEVDELLKDIEIMEENTKLNLIDSQIEYIENHINRINDLENELNSTQRFKYEASYNEDYENFLNDNNFASGETPENVLGMLIKEKESLEKEPEVEKNAFNNAELFVDEYKDYLIGKRIKYNDKNHKDLIVSISHVSSDSDNLVNFSTNDVEEFYWNVNTEDLQTFIDGEDVIENVGDSEYKFNLILQEEIVEEKPKSPNQPGYKYYIVDQDKMKIKSGHEYKEDALDENDKLISFGQKNTIVLTKRNLNEIHWNLNPEDSNNWSNELVDYSIIEEAVNFGVTEGEYTEEAAKNYIEKYRNEGKYAMVIKARLVYYLEHADKHFRKAIINSEYEKALRFKETEEKIQNELLNIIKKDI